MTPKKETNVNVTRQSKQVLNIRGFTVVLKQSGGFKSAGIYVGMAGRRANGSPIPKYIVTVRDWNDLRLLKSLIEDKEALDEIIKVFEKFLSE